MLPAWFPLLRVMGYLSRVDMHRRRCTIDGFSLLHIGSGPKVRALSFLRKATQRHVRLVIAREDPPSASSIIVVVMLA